VRVSVATWVAVKARIGVLVVDTAPMALPGATFLCAIGDPLSFLEIAVLSGSALANSMMNGNHS
jgi:hypothetical protein